MLVVVLNACVKLTNDEGSAVISSRPSLRVGRPPSFAGFGGSVRPAG